MDALGPIRNHLIPSMTPSGKLSANSRFSRLSMKASNPLEAGKRLALAIRPAISGRMMKLIHR
jgi:hypothetical protein